MAHPVLVVFLTALLLRVVSAVVISSLFGGSLAPDDLTYSDMAVAVAEEERGGWDAFTHELYRRTYSFLRPLALIYSITGETRLAGQIYVGVLGALAAALATKVALEVVGPRWALFAGGAVALLPSQILWSSLVLKDAAVWVFLAALAVTLTVMNRSKGWGVIAALTLAAGLLIGLAHLREHTMVVAAWSLGAAALAGGRHWFFPRVGGAALVAIGIPWLVGIGPAGVTLVTDAGSLEQRRLLNAQGAASAFIEESAEGPATSDPLVEATVLEQEAQTKILPRAAALQERAAAMNEAAAAAEAKFRTLRASVRSRGTPADDLSAQLQQLQRKRRRLQEKSRAAQVKAEELRQQAADARARAAALRETITTDDVDEAQDEGRLDPSLAHLPEGLFVMLLEPVPWVTSGSGALRAARLEAVVWYPLLLLAGIGLVQARHHLRVMLFPILAGGGMLLLYALTEGNIGTAFRHRGEFVWVAAVLAALGGKRVVEWRQAKIGASDRQPDAAVT